MRTDLFQKRFFLYSAAGGRGCGDPPAGDPCDRKGKPLTGDAGQFFEEDESGCPAMYNGIKKHCAADGRGLLRSVFQKTKRFLQREFSGDKLRRDYFSSQIGSLSTQRPKLSFSKRSVL